MWSTMALKSEDAGKKITFREDLCEVRFIDEEAKPSQGDQKVLGERGQQEQEIEKHVERKLTKHEEYDMYFQQVLKRLKDEKEMKKKEAITETCIKKEELLQGRGEGQIALKRQKAAVICPDIGSALLFVMICMTFCAFDFFR